MLELHVNLCICTSDMIVPQHSYACSSCAIIFGEHIHMMHIQTQVNTATDYDSKVGIFTHDVYLHDIDVM